MGAIKDIYTTAMIMSDLEERFNELEEQCVAVNEADDDYPCDCNFCADRDEVSKQIQSLYKEWVTYPIAIRNDAWQMVMEEKVVNA